VLYYTAAFNISINYFQPSATQPDFTILLSFLYNFIRQHVTATTDRKQNILSLSLLLIIVLLPLLSGLTRWSRQQTSVAQDRARLVLLSYWDG